MRLRLRYIVMAVGGLVAATILFTVSCGDDPASSGDNQPLSVVSTTPAASEVNVSTSVIITATFSQDLDPASVTHATFYVEPSVAGSVSSGGATATFVPAPGSLDLNTVYQATLTTGITSVGGTTLSGNYAWAFRTEADSVEKLVDRYEVALNSHDTSHIGVLMLDDFLHNGRDKACYLDYLKQSFVRYPAVTFSLDLVSTTSELDYATMVLHVTSFDGGLIIPYTDTVITVRVDGRWYLNGNQQYYSPGILVVRYSHDNQYVAVPILNDNSDRAALITVTGTGFPAQQSMVQSGSDCTSGFRWSAPTLYLSGDPPSPLPLTYSYLIQSPYGATSLIHTTEDYFGEYATPIYPLQTDIASGSFSFIWHPVPGYQTLNYGIRLGNGWEKYTDFEDTTLLYDGPALTGDSMHYYLIARPRGQSAYSARSVYFRLQ